MTRSVSKVQQFILQAIVPILCSIAIGFVFNQGNVFDRHYGAFQFVWSGVVASVFYYLLVFVRLRDAVLGFMVLFLLTFLTTESTRLAFILRDIFYVGGIGLSIFIFFRYFRQSLAHNFAYAPFMLAGIYAVMYMVTSEIHWGILRTFVMEDTGGSAVGLASTATFFGVLIGFAVGCGIALNEKLAGIKKTGRLVLSTIMILLLAIIAVMVSGQFSMHPQTREGRTGIDDSLSISPTDLMRSGLVYISHIALDHVSVLDPETNRLIGKIKSGSGPCCVDLTPDRGYIGNYRSNDVTVFDRKTGKTIAAVPAGEHPSHLSLTSDGKYLLIGHESNDGLWFLDTRTNQISKKLSEGTGILCRHDNGKKIYQSQIFIPYVFVIDPETQMIVKRIKVGGRPLDLAFTPDQKHLYIANYDLNELEEIDTETDSVVARIPHVTSARGIAITHDARFAFVTNVVSSTVMVVDLASTEIVKTIPVGSMPTSVAFRADGKYAYVSCQGGASVVVIDTQTQEIVQSIVVDNNPIQVQVK